MQGEDIWAIVVGIDHYYLYDDLKGCENDADDVYAYLMKSLNAPQSNITLLKGNAATRSDMIAAFDALLTNKAISEKSLVLFYFAGHGTLVRMSKKQPQHLGRLVKSICPYDEGMKDRNSGKKICGIPQPTLQAVFDCLEARKKCNAVITTSFISWDDR